MILNINEGISNIVTDKIAQSLNTLKSGEKLLIYLCSQGGDVNPGEAIIDIINNK